MKTYDGLSVKDSEMSEKYDGVQAVWTGSELKTRTGGIINAPEWWVADLPKRKITGELFAGRGRFDYTSGVVRSIEPDERWNDIRFMVFDGIAKGCYSETVKRITVLSKNHLNDFYRSIIEKGGEGVVVKTGGECFKMKPKDDMEGIVVDHVAGKGKHAGRMGALVLKLRDDRILKLGTGFSDLNRINPPPVGSIVKFEYEGLTSKGIPRFARFIGVRAESDLKFSDDDKPLKFKSGRGGKRKGSGRPKGLTDKSMSEARRRVPMSIRLPRWLKLWVEKQDKSSGKVIEAALIEHYKLKK